MEQEKFQTWAIIEFMGHNRYAGLVTEETRFGITMLRLDIPDGERMITQYYHPNSLYRLTPVSEEIARGVAVNSKPMPVLPYELPAPKRQAIDSRQDYNDDDYIDPED